jgi:hypothetical protein
MDRNRQFLASLLLDKVDQAIADILPPHPANVANALIRVEEQGVG